MDYHLEFEAVFASVKPIIYKMQSNYYIKLWDKEDWLQEGRIILYQLLEKNQGLFERDKVTFYRYFKTRFSSRLMDVIRKQESQKRRFDRMAYEEIGEFAHAIKEKGMWVDDIVAYQEVFLTFWQGLDDNEKVKVDKMLCGRSFNGKSKMIRELQIIFKEFYGQIYR